MIEAMEVRLYEHENFVWLDHSAVSEVLDNRKPASSDPMVIYNNLLRWSLYQLDRNACVEIDDKTGNDIPLQERLNWIRRYKTVFKTNNCIYGCFQNFSDLHFPGALKEFSTTT